VGNLYLPSAHLGGQPYGPGGISKTGQFKGTGGQSCVADGIDPSRHLAGQPNNEGSDPSLHLGVKEGHPEADGFNPPGHSYGQPSEAG